MAIFTGTSDGERIDGGNGADIIVGLGGDDRLFGGGGNDVISGGDGADRLRGGNGDDRLLTDGDDRLVSGGRGVDVAILDGDRHSFTFDHDNMRAIEGIHDQPGNDSTVTFDPAILSDVEGGRFTLALGDGDDTVRLLGDNLEQVGDTLVWNDRVVLAFDGVERVVAVDGQDGGSKVFSFHESPTKPATQPDIEQTAEIIQRALGNGDIDQNASIDQSASAKGGKVSQDASIEQSASASGGGHVSQNASISQNAVAFGGDGRDHGTDAANDFMFPA